MTRSRQQQTGPLTAGHQHRLGGVGQYVLMTHDRSIAELADVANPAWPEVIDAVEAAAGDRQILPVDEAQGRRTLHQLQVSAGSWLGAMALNCGGVLVDHGWLRLLGGGHGGLADLASMNGLGDPSAADGPPSFLVVAYDVLGGRFAIDGGGLGGTPGEVAYWAPDTMRWDGLGMGHAAFVRWSLSGGLAEFAASLRWPGWEQETATLKLDQAIAVYPFLFTAEGRDISTCRRRAVAASELFDLHDDLARQIENLPDQTPVAIRWAEAAGEAE
jgi:hypothetical protein